MNDSKLLRESSKEARRGIQNRSGRYLPYLEDFLKNDQTHRTLLQAVEALRSKRNALSGDIGKAKAAKDEAKAKTLMKDVASIKEKMEKQEKALEQLSV